MKRLDGPTVKVHELESSVKTIEVDKLDILSDNHQQTQLRLGIQDFEV